MTPPPRTPHRDVDGPLAWREAGPRGPRTDTGTTDTIVFLHGLGGSRTAWDAQLDDLADRWRCVAWDMPGYGASDPLDGPLTFARLADAVVELLDTLDVARVHLVGLSFGGMIAQHTALAHPGRVDRLVLVDTSPAFGLDGTDPVTWKRLRLDRLDRGETPADMARDVITAVAGPGLTGAALESQIAAMTRIPPEGLRAAVECLPSHDLTSRLRGVTAPTLVVVGEHDTETPPDYARRLADAIPGARLEVIPGAGHLTPAEAPDQLDTLVRAHLEPETGPASRPTADQEQS